MFVQDLTIDILKEQIIKSNNLLWIEVFIYLVQPILLTFVTYAFISALNQCETYLTKLCYLTSQVSRNFISEHELKCLSKKNLRKILFFILFHLLIIFPIGYVK